MKLSSWAPAQVMNVLCATASYTPPATGRRSVRAAAWLTGVMTVNAGAGTGKARAAVSRSGRGWYTSVSVPTEPVQTKHSHMWTEKFSDQWVVGAHVEDAPVVLHPFQQNESGDERTAGEHLQLVAVRRHRGARRPVDDDAQPGLVDVEEVVHGHLADREQSAAQPAPV